jgi:hypothetical protein
MLRQKPVIPRPPNRVHPEEPISQQFEHRAFLDHHLAIAHQWLAPPGRHRRPKGRTLQPRHCLRASGKLRDLLQIQKDLVPTQTRDRRVRAGLARFLQKRRQQRQGAY